jgi:hypothetical protein
MITIETQAYIGTFILLGWLTMLASRQTGKPIFSLVGLNVFSLTGILVGVIYGFINNITIWYNISRTHNSKWVALLWSYSVTVWIAFLIDILVAQWVGPVPLWSNFIGNAIGCLLGLYVSLPALL